MNIHKDDSADATGAGKSSTSDMVLLDGVGMDHVMAANAEGYPRVSDMGIYYAKY